MLDNSLFMPSDDAQRLVHRVIDLLKEKRVGNGSKENTLSLRALAARADLDPSALSRAEDKQRIPSFAFFVDWCAALDTSIEEVVKEARTRL